MKIFSWNLRFRNIINVSNGVLGISVLTMPYCFEQVSLNIFLKIKKINKFLTKLVDFFEIVLRRNKKTIYFSVVFY